MAAVGTVAGAVVAVVAVAVVAAAVVAVAMAVAPRSRHCHPQTAMTSYLLVAGWEIRVDWRLAAVEATPDAHPEQRVSAPLRSKTRPAK